MSTLELLAGVIGLVTIEDGIATLEDGTTIDLVAEAAKQAELLESTRALITSFQTGECYETSNPYTRPCVKRALTAIKDFTGFTGDWMDANSLPPK
jgi:hypothetical protein